ncbi:serine hydrolase [Dokdonella sp.]|uniref:serine hydrolase n=1 Tax=Dokdonella sp. TaxID=2291710 RepID=UPI0035271F8A
MRLMLACVLIALLLSTRVAPAIDTIAPATAEPVEQDAPADLPPEPVRAIDTLDLAAYVDGLVDAAMQSDHLAGVTVAIVDRQGPLLLRGYGIAAQSPRKGVDPKSSLFRIGSISKTFTYLLALQMVDDGRLEINAPVNNYLPPDLQLPDDGLAPVLVRHLFTHTAGYEDSAMGHLFVKNPEDVSSLQEYVRLHRPARVRQPGTHAVYSNYSLALLGVILEQVSGKSFETLVESRLLQPTGMQHTTFREPLGKDDPRNAGTAFEGLWSEGFKRGGGGYSAQTFEHIAHIAPVGGASSTASDMGRYMRMLLDAGSIDGAQILAPSVLERIYSTPQFRNAPEVTGFSWGFFASRIGSLDLYGHGGATLWFHSSMQLIPELGLGVFISTNTETGRRFAGEFPGLVLQRYFPEARSEPPTTAPETLDASRFIGSYNSERSNYSSIEKLFLSSTLQVAAAPDGALVISGEGSTSRYVPDGDLSFREAEGPGYITFLVDADNRIVGFANAKGHVVYDRVRPWDVLPTAVNVLGVIGIIALFVLTGAWLRRKRRIRDQPRARFSARWLYFTAFLWIVILGAGLTLIEADNTELFYDFPSPIVRFIAWAAVPVILASLISVYLLGSAWKAKDWGFWRKLRHTLAVLAFSIGAFLLWNWNLLPWKL